MTTSNPLSACGKSGGILHCNGGDIPFDIVDRKNLREMTIFLHVDQSPGFINSWKLKQPDTVDDLLILTLRNNRKWFPKGWRFDYHTWVTFHYDHEM